MARTRFIIVGLALLVVALCTSACTVSLGHPSGQTSSSVSTVATSAAPVAATSSAVPTLAATPTVTVTRHAKHKVVQVIEQDPTTYVAPQPSSYSSVLSVYDSAMSAENSGFYNGGGAYFVSPSGNIACYVSDSVSCSIHRYDFPQPGPDCDAGIGAQLDSYGSAELTDCSGYFGTNIGADTLQYGQSVSYGNFACVSESSAVSCLDFDTDTGFSLSRAAFNPVS